MTITAKLRNAPDVRKVAYGQFIDTGTVKDSVFAIGFIPRRIVLLEATTPIRYEWFEGMAAGYVEKIVAAGTHTVETSGGPTVGEIEVTAAVTLYEQTAYAVGTPTVAPAEETDCSRVVSTGKYLGFKLPAALIPASKQFYFFAEA